MGYLFTKIIGDDRFILRHRILNFVLFSFTIFTVVAVISNYFTGEPFIVQFFAVFFFFYFLFSYFVSRFKKKWKFIAHLTILTSFVGIIVFFLLDGGLYCGNGYFFLVDIAIIISLFQGKNRLRYIFAATIILFILLLLEAFYPQVFTRLNTKQCSANIFLSFIVTVFASIFLLTLFVSQLEKQKNEIEILSKEDFLTGVFNRRGIFEKLNYLIKASGKNDFLFSIILIDIDNFKMVNDNYGHLNGDIVLKEIAKRISESLRGGDILGRWGGEEFIVVLPYADLKNAVYIAERIRRNIKKFPIKCGEFLISVTATFGVGEYNRNLTLNKNLTLIDNALYEGKASGRDCIVRVKEE